MSNKPSRQECFSERRRRDMMGEYLSGMVYLTFMHKSSLSFLTGRILPGRTWRTQEKKGLRALQAMG